MNNSKIIWWSIVIILAIIIIGSFFWSDDKSKSTETKISGELSRKSIPQEKWIVSCNTMQGGNLSGGGGSVCCIVTNSSGSIISSVQCSSYRKLDTEYIAIAVNEFKKQKKI